MAQLASCWKIISSNENPNAIGLSALAALQGCADEAYSLQRTCAGSTGWFAEFRRLAVNQR